MPKINAQHFRRRANEARIAAQAMRNPKDKRLLLTIAEKLRGAGQAGEHIKLSRS